jgi:mannose-6-phosphate isomerase-like protein (cupin superfamily)
MQSPNQFDLSTYARRTEKPWGYEVCWTPSSKPYVGKLIHINAGARLSLQIHDQKSESWYLVSGRAKVIWEREPDGALLETELEALTGYSCEAGQRHRLIGVTACDIIEVSTPEVGITLRLEDDYSRADETLGGPV